VGATVLDVCCGSGASALPAAAAVGPTGRVVAIDLAESMLALGRAKASARGLANVEFRHGDLLDLRLPERSFDAVVCVFGVFFVPDIPAAIAALWRMVRPGGQLAITTWGPQIFEPATHAFWEAVGAERPDLVQAWQPWDRTVEPEPLRAALAAGGVETAQIMAVAGTHPIEPRTDWWPIVMGTGYRATVDRLDPEAAARVREHSTERLVESGVTEIQVNVIFAIARRPASVAV